MIPGEHEIVPFQRRLQALHALPLLPGTATALAASAHAIHAGNLTAGLVRRDPGLAAKILRLANASVFEDQATCNLEHACEWLGVRGLSAVLREMQGQPPLEGPAWEAFQARCVITGIAAHCIAVSLGEAEPEELYSAGLLTGLGAIARAAAGEARDTAPQNDAEAGVLVADNWQLPHRLIAWLRPGTGAAPPAREAQMVRLATLLAENFGCRDREQNRRAAVVIMQVSRELGLAPTQVAGLLKEVQRAVETDKADQSALLSQLAEPLTVAEDTAPLPSAQEPAPAQNEPPLPLAAEVLPPVEPVNGETGDETDDLEAVENAHPAPILTEVASWERGSLRVRGTGSEQPHTVAPLTPRAPEGGNEEPRDERPPANRPRPRIRLLLAAGLGALLFVCMFLARRDAPATPSADNAGLTLHTLEGEKHIAISEALSFVSLNPIAPETPGYLIALGRYYEGQHNDREAAKYLQQLADKYPAWPGTRDIYQPLATAYEHTDNTEAATRIYRLIIKSFPETAPEYHHAKTRLDAGH